MNKQCIEMVKLLLDYVDGSLEDAKSEEFRTLTSSLGPAASALFPAVSMAVFAAIEILMEPSPVMLLIVTVRVFPLPLYWSVGVNAYPTYRAPQWIRWTFFSLGMSLDALNVYWAIRLVKGAMRQWRER